MYKNLPFNTTKMKTQFSLALKATALVLTLSIPTVLKAQKTIVSNLRPYDQSGINVYEAPKDSVTVFEKLKIQFGGGFTQSFQNVI